MKIDWEPLHRIIDAHERFVISSHVRPDADAIGSALGLACVLEARGKQVQIINPSASPANLAWLDPQHRVHYWSQPGSSLDLSQAQVHIVVDTSAWNQLADVGRWMRTADTVKVVIDHHVSSDDLGAIEFKDTTSEATGSLIYKLAESMGATLTPEAATALYAAIATDTGWFRFSATSGSTMRIIGALMDLGARPEMVFRMLYEQATLARLHLAGRVLSRVVLEPEFELAYTWVTWDDFVELGAVPADTEDLVNECLKIAGTKAAFIAIEQMNRQVKVSFRSRTSMNVAAVAEQFQGGGHKQAAGATLPGPFPQAMEKVLAAVRQACGDSPPRAVPPVPEPSTA